MKHAILAVLAVLLFTAWPWAQTPVRPAASLVRVKSRTTKHRPHAHGRHTSRHRSRRHHSA